jgi:hypothetical protein
MIYSFCSCVKWVGAACAGMLLAALTTDTTWSQREATSPAQALTNWLECEKCEHGELEAVTRDGQDNVNALIAALRDGPQLGNLPTALEERYEQLVEQSKKNPYAPIAATKEQFVALYLGNFDAQGRVRAAQGLGVIGGPDARRALEAAAANQALRDDVRATARDCLRRLAQ